MQNLKLTPVDLIDDGEVLSKIEDASLDFIIANHFIEHTRNPIGTILAWLAKLKASGVIFLAVPDYRYTFDSGRQLTSLVHLVADHESPIGLVRARDRQHCVEWATFVAKVPAEQVDEHAELLIEGDYSIHFHTFTLASFLDLLNYMHTQLRAPVVLKACADVTHDGNEFLVVLTRTP